MFHARASAAAAAAAEIYLAYGYSLLSHRSLGLYDSHHKALTEVTRARSEQEAASLMQELELGMDQPVWFLVLIYPATMVLDPRIGGQVSFRMY